MQAISETIFESVYLIFAIFSGIFIILRNRRNYALQLFGLACLVLGIGDSFHLIPRMIGLLTTGLEDYTYALGIGKYITSITMTVFYVFLYYSLKLRYRYKMEKSLDISYLALGIIRIVLCILPQNEWTSSNPSLTFAIIRNIPFVIMGIMIIVLTYHWCKDDYYFKHLWLLILLSFAFYIPVVLLASLYPLVGLLMLPKTICYMIIIYRGLKQTIQKETS